MQGSRHAPRHRAGRARRLVQVGAGVTAVALVVGVATVVLAADGGDGPAPEVAAADGPAATTTAPSTSTTTTTTAPPAPQPIAPADEPVFAPTPAPAPGPIGDSPADGAVVEAPPLLPPPPPPPPPVTADLSLSPGTMPVAYSMAAPPVLAWSTTGAGAVLVSGPGFSSSAVGGSAPICPGSTAAVCTASPGTYTYTLVAWDTFGDMAAPRSVTLTIA